MIASIQKVRVPTKPLDGIDNNNNATTREPTMAWVPIIPLVSSAPPPRP